MPPSTEVGAYFYPLTGTCPARLTRTMDVGKALDIDLDRVDEFALARDARPLFEGHDQPQSYCLPYGQDILTEWDDTDGHTLVPQLVAASTHGLSFLIFDSYTGVKNDRRMAEMDKARRVMNTIPTLGNIGLRYAKMETLESARVVLPIPYSGATERSFSTTFSEPGRPYDITPETAKLIVDSSAEEWRGPTYLRVAGRPYLSVLMPNFPVSTPPSARISIMSEFMETLSSYAAKKYDEFPYLVGVMRQVSDVGIWNSIGVNAITQYCHLPDPSPSIQQYPELVGKRERDWHRLHEMAGGTPFIPSPAVGWDASPRGEQGHRFDEVDGMHPYTPVVVGNTPQEVARMLSRAIQFTEQHVPPNQRLVTMFAWNEITEGAALLPHLRKDGTVDNSYLEAIRDVIVREAVPSIYTKR